MLHLTASAWSLAEIQIDNADFRWLCSWAEQLHSGVAYRCLIELPWRKFDNAERNFSFASAMGILLLLLAVEIARREASERVLWSTLQRSYFSDTTKHILFAQGHPTRPYKDAIELAARRFKLRHVFGEEGVQNWFDTIFLQLGFTKRGFMHRLPEWLVGQGQTLAIQQLRYGPKSSNSFNQLWQTLLDYRRKILTEQQFRRQLGNNPWILPEWIEDLMRQASARLHLGSGENVSTKSADTKEIAEQFLETPTLRWDISNPPQFICRVINLANLDLAESHYTLIISGHECGWLQKRIDGSYQVEPPTELVVPTVSPSLVASLIDPNEQVVHSQTLQLWDESEDVTAFNASSGHRFNPWKNVVRIESAYILLLATDLTIEPQPKHFYNWHVQGRSIAKMFFLQRDWPAQTSVLLQGEPLWQPYFTQSSFNSERTIKDTIHVHIYEIPQKLFFGGSIRLSITHPKDVMILSIRSGGQTIHIERKEATQAITEPIVITPNLFAHEGNYLLELFLGIRGASGSARIRHTVEIPITGAALLTPDGWAILDGKSTLTVEQARLELVKFFLLNTEKWVLLEGNTWVGKLWKRLRLIGSLSGYGASLLIQEGSAYNAQYHETYVLAQEVIDQGIIAEIEFDASTMADRVLSIRLTRQINLDEDYKIVCWDHYGTFHKFAPECNEMQLSAMWWLSTIPPDLSQPLVVAIAYRGIRLGTWWRVNWSQALQEIQDPPTIAAMLRWFQLPLLSSNIRTEIQQFAYTYPDVVLKAWLEETQLPLQLRYVERSDEWLSVVRTIFRGWQSDISTVRKIVIRLGGDETKLHPQDILINVVSKLSRVSPILMGNIIMLLIESVYIPEWGIRTAHALLQILMSDIAELINNEEMIKKKKMLEEEVAVTMDVDSVFVEKALIQRALSVLQGQPLSVADEHNIEMALNIEPFRRILALRILEKIDQMMVVRR